MIENTTFIGIIWVLLIVEIVMLCYLIFIFLRIKKTAENLMKKLEEKLHQKKKPSKKKKKKIKRKALV